MICINLLDFNDEFIQKIILNQEEGILWEKKY